MLRRSVKVQLALFVIITLIGVGYVGGKYVGLFNGIIESNGCTVSAEFPESGGIFTNAEVTYRGVAVGKVGTLHLFTSGSTQGVRVDLHLTNCRSPKIPTSSVAYVSDRSVIGEQYVNLVPPNDKGPYLGNGQTIPMHPNTLPVTPETLLTNLDNLVKSVNTNNLQIVVSELGQAFNGRGPALGTLLDSTNLLLTAAQQNLQPTLALLKSADTVLTTQLREGPALASFSRSLNQLSATLKSSDPVIRSLLTNGPADLGVVQSFITDNQTDLGVTLANLATTGQLLVKHLGGIEQILELYPVLAAGAQSALRPSGSAGVIGALGLVLNNATTPADCGSPNGGREGYGTTQLRPPTDVSPAAPNTAALCTLPPSSGTDVRGSANVPGGDPISVPQNVQAYPRATTQDSEQSAAAGSATQPVNVGISGYDGVILGDDSWLPMLTNGLS